MSLRFVPFIVVLILLTSVLAPGRGYAQGDVRGTILYGATQYRAEVNGVEAQRAKSQYGQVSLSYTNQGILGDARAGQYSLMLGYEFNTIAPSLVNYGVKDPLVGDIESGKLLYNADLLVAPGGLPFRLSLFARDIHQSVISGGRGFINSTLGRQYDSSSSLIDSEVNTEIANGSHRMLGGTLLIGIRNGSYLGAYRDVLSQIPRILIDYKQIEVTDLKARDLNLTHYRARDLAFISLNKKDNWMHLRMHDYTDFLDSSNDKSTSEIMIGTIDHTLTRQWVNFTNWIKVSGDLSYRTEKNARYEFPEKTYALNLLALAQQKKTKASILSSFDRTVIGTRMLQDVDLPINFTYERDRDTLLRTRLRSDFSRESSLESFEAGSADTLRQNSNIFLSLSADLFRTRPVVFTPDLQLEIYKNNGIDGFAEKLNLEWASRRGAQGLFWSTGVRIQATQSSDGTKQSSYQEGGIYGRAEKDLSKRLRVGLRGDLSRGSGSDAADAAGTIQRLNLQISESSAQLNPAAEDTLLRYQMRFFLDHTGEYYDNRLSFGVEAIKIDAASLSAYTLEHVLQRRQQKSKFNLTTKILAGDRVSVANSYFDFLAEDVDSQGVDFNWSSKAEYSYAPDRRLLFALNGMISGSEGTEGKKQQGLSFSESLAYRFFTINGIIRKLAEISQEIGWEQIKESEDGREQAYRLRLDGSLYPTKYFYAKAGTEWVFFNPGGSQQFKLVCETGLKFSKAQVVLSYARGFKEEERALPESMEERWDLKMNKIF